MDKELVRMDKELVRMDKELVRMDKDLVVIIMAGGLGTRMESNVPKVIHQLGGSPMINHILRNLQKLQEKINLKQIFIVVGKYRNQIQEAIENDLVMTNITYVNQPEALGTGHAIQCCLSELIKYPNSNTLILSGDVPMFSIDSMFNLVNKLDKARITITTNVDPTGYGRIIITNDKFERIVEHNDCTPEQLNIVKINCGIYAFNSQILCKWLPYITNNNKKREYYLTDIVEIIRREENIEIELYDLPPEKMIEVIGVNTISQLNELDKLIR
jgi:UDP-N-acetylglucosamine diphosphorylase/glucosamine-1-phosphate N-acetyltransferase